MEGIWAFHTSIICSFSSQQVHLMYYIKCGIHRGHFCVKLLFYYLIELTGWKEFDTKSLNFYFSVDVEPGLYYVEVEGYADDIGIYQLHTEFVMGDDHGDDTLTATTIACSAASWNLDIPGVINKQSDIDVFELKLQHASFVTVYTEGDTDTAGVLKNSSGIALASNDDRSSTDENFRITRDLSEGTYYVHIEGRTSDTSKYRLNLAVTTD